VGAALRRPSCQVKPPFFGAFRVVRPYHLGDDGSVVQAEGRFARCLATTRSVTRFLAVRCSGPVERKLAALQFASRRIEAAVVEEHEAYPHCFVRAFKALRVDERVRIALEPRGRCWTARAMEQLSQRRSVSSFGVLEAVKSQWTVPEAVRETSREG